MPKTITRQIEVYEFDELAEDAQLKAINNEIEFILEITEYEQADNDLKRAIDECEKMQTPWFIHEYVWEHCKDYIESNLRGYTYLQTGKVFDY